MTVYSQTSTSRWYERLEWWFLALASVWVGSIQGCCFISPKVHGISFAPFQLLRSLLGAISWNHQTSHIPLILFLLEPHKTRDRFLALEDFSVIRQHFPCYKWGVVWAKHCQSRPLYTQSKPFIQLPYKNWQKKPNSASQISSDNFILSTTHETSSRESTSTQN